MRLSDGRRIWSQWLAAASWWQGWSVCPVLLAPEVESSHPRPAARGVTDRAAKLATQLASQLATGGTLLLLDLEPNLGVYVASALYEQRVAQPVLVLPRWPYAQAILPCDVLQSSLAMCAPRGPVVRCANACFVLDAERERSVPDRPIRDRRADNRHRLAAHDLPTLNDLQARGIGRVVRLFAA